MSASNLATNPHQCFFLARFPALFDISYSCFFDEFSGARGVDGLLSKSWRWRRCSCSKTSASVGVLSVSATGFGSQPNPRFNSDVARLSFFQNGRSSLLISSSSLFKNSVPTYSLSSKISAGFFKSLRHQLFRSLPGACVCVPIC